MKSQILLVSISFVFMTFPGLATVSLSTEPSQVFVQYSSQVGGIITFTVENNDFYVPGPPSTSTKFTRIRLDRQAEHQNSQVGWPGTDPLLRQDPIYLPLELINAPAGSQLAAPPDTVAIVRWLETENVVWFQVKHSTETWIRNPQGNLVAPSVENGFVQFKIGLPSLDSHSTYYPLFLADLANLPGATRDLSWVSDPQNPAFCTSPEWLLNLENSSLSACPDPDCELVFDIIAFIDTAFDGSWGVFTAPINGYIDQGMGTGVHFTGEDVLAFGRLRSEVPTLSSLPLILFITLLSALGIFMIRRK